MTSYSHSEFDLTAEVTQNWLLGCFVEMKFRPSCPVRVIKKGLLRALKQPLFNSNHLNWAIHLFVEIYLAGTQLRTGGGNLQSICRLRSVICDRPIPIAPKSFKSV